MNFSFEKKTHLKTNKGKIVDDKKKQIAFRNKELPKSLQKKISTKQIIFILLIILWCIVIFTFSNMPSNESNSKSKDTINIVTEKTLKITNKTGITNKHPSIERMNNFIENLNKPLRKCMHASVYLVLSILIFYCLKKTKLNNGIISLLSVILSFLYACTDEFHQMFVSGRTSEWLDVMIDTVGAILGVVVINTIFKIIHKAKEKAK